ncbi:hypothetical protein [Actinacidiphila oryziradicis]|uniref:Uncharacterized protein n=1 Tax=Actinacidiphila oryziradicis TaxID=2571141 RepID=A0A4U0RLY1_9ACTN|nr:hypothetical protein [Actinacidiphila oryziradicis]TJZ96246.1 hypothetical protein FCI23_51270 [Actinacidiphila oryziradicis]
MDGDLSTPRLAQQVTRQLADTVAAWGARRRRRAVLRGDRYSSLYRLTWPERVRRPALAVHRAER